MRFKSQSQRERLRSSVCRERGERNERFRAEVKRRLRMKLNETRLARNLRLRVCATIRVCLSVCVFVCVCVCGSTCRADRSLAKQLGTLFSWRLCCYCLHSVTRTNTRKDIHTDTHTHGVWRYSYTCSQLFEI